MTGKIQRAFETCAETVGNAILPGTFTMNNLAGVRRDSTKSAELALE